MPDSMSDVLEHPIWSLSASLSSQTHSQIDSTFPWPPEMKIGLVPPSLTGILTRKICQRGLTISSMIMEDLKKRSLKPPLLVHQPNQQQKIKAQEWKKMVPSYSLSACFS